MKNFTRFTILSTVVPFAGLEFLIKVESCFKKPAWPPHLKLVWLVVDYWLVAGQTSSTSYNFKLYFPITKDGHPSCEDDWLHEFIMRFMSVFHIKYGYLEDWWRNPTL